MPTSPASDASWSEYGPSMSGVSSRLTVVPGTHHDVRWLLAWLAAPVSGLSDEFCVDVVAVHTAKTGVA
jgi:hypothetical protein